MPFGKISRSLINRSEPPANRTKRARRVKKRSSFGRRATTAYNLYKTPNPIPDRMFLKLAYSDTFPLIAATSLTDTHMFRTSQYDVDLSGTGHQPLGRDQWAVFYQNYRIHALSYTLTGVNNSTTHSADMHVVHKATSSVVGNYNTAWEKPYAKHAILGPELSGSSKGVIKGTLHCAKTLGVTKEKYRTDDKTGSAFGTHPATMLYLHCIGASSDGLSGCNITCRIQLSIHLEYYNRVPLTES